jgi:hypothetical protein
MARVPYSGVPEETVQVGAPDDLQREQASPAAFGGGIAQGLEKVGAGALDAAKFYGQVAADDGTNNTLQQVTNILHGDPNKKVMGPDGALVPDTGYYGKRGADAMSARPEVSQQIDEIIRQNRESLSTPQSQEQYDTDTRRYRAQWLTQIGSHADEQQKIWTQSVNKTTAELSLNLLAQKPSDTIIETQARENVRSAYVKQAQMDGVDPRAAVLRADQDIALTRVRALLPTDPAGAQKALTDNSKVLASLPDYDSLSQVVKSRVATSQIGPLADSLVEQAKMGAGSTSPTPVPNNLGNVKSGATSFAVPATPLDGAILAANNLRGGYQGMTLSQIGKKWEGTTPEHIQNWINNVSKGSGIAPDATPDLNNPAVLNSLLKGIASAEKSPADQLRFDDNTISQGVQASLAGKHPALAAPAPGKVSYPSLADYYRANSAQILDDARSKAQGLHPDDPEFVDRVVARVERGINLTISQQQQGYEVSTHVVQQALSGAMTNGTKPISIEQLEATNPQVAAAWENMQINNPYAAMHIQSVFDANSKGRAIGYGQGFNQLLSRVMAPHGDPSRIADVTNMWPMVGDENSALTNTGLETLTKVMSYRGTPQGEADIAQIRHFMQYAHGEISKANPQTRLDDPRGEHDFQRYVALALPFIDQKIKNGEPVGTLFNPKSPDYLGQYVANFKRSSQQMIFDTMNAFTPAPPTQTTVDPTSIKTPTELKRAFANGQITLQDGNALAIQRGWWAGTPPPVPIVH